MGWAILIIAIMLLAGCDEQTECPTALTLQCPVCGDWLVDGGYCSTCCMWYNVECPIIEDGGY